MRTLLLLGCGLLWISCDAPPSDTDAGDVTDAGARDDAGTTGGLSVTVHFPDGGAGEVALSGLATEDLEGATVVRLSLVVTTALPEVTLSEVRVGFKASDGFDPASRGNCMSLLPLEGARLTQGGIDPVTRNLNWEDALGYAGCMYVNDLTDLFLTQP